MPKGGPASRDKQRSIDPRKGQEPLLMDHANQSEAEQAYPNDNVGWSKHAGQGSKNQASPRATTQSQDKASSKEVVNQPDRAPTTILSLVLDIFRWRIAKFVDLGIFFRFQRPLPRPRLERSHCERRLQTVRESACRAEPLPWARDRQAELRIPRFHISQCSAHTPPQKFGA